MTRFAFVGLNDMRKRWRLPLTAVLLAAGSVCLSSEQISKEQALARIDSCLHQSRAFDRGCENLNASIDVLIRAYKSNEKSVLPVLLNFGYLTDFFDDALLSDPGGFLSAVGALVPERQNAVLEGLAGPQFRTLPRERFLAIKAVLEAVPPDSPNRSIAGICLEALNEHNAALFVDYFPLGTFTGPAAQLTNFWYSRVLYGLREQPLWGGSQTTEETWRFTHIGAWGRSQTVSLFIHSNGSGSIRLRSFDLDRTGSLSRPDSIEIPADQVSRFLEALKGAEFWTASTHIRSNGLDGAEWVLEGQKQGQYHIVTRWCPGTESKSPDILAFAEACRLLLKYAGHPYKGDC